jgi:hypothetical protein
VEEVEGKLITKTVDGQLFFKVNPRCPWMTNAIGDCVVMQKSSCTNKHHGRRTFTKSSVLGDIMKLRNDATVDGGVEGELSPHDGVALKVYKSKGKESGFLSQAQQNDNYANPKIVAVTLPGETPLSTAALKMAKKFDVPFLRLDPKTVGRFIHMVRNSTVVENDEDDTPNQSSRTPQGCGVATGGRGVDTG